MCTLSTQQFCYTPLAHSLQNYVVTVHQKVGNGTIVVTVTIYYLNDRSVANMHVCLFYNHLVAGR